MMRYINSNFSSPWRPNSELRSWMNYSYFYTWKTIFTGRMDELSFKIDINKCPIFFAYGD